MSTFKCTYAFPGTYGHECGKPATLVGARPSELTRDGVYYARRCPECATYTGRDNAGIREWAQLDPEKHVNRF
jgi:hypothetical protein